MENVLPGNFCARNGTASFIQERTSSCRRGMQIDMEQLMQARPQGELIWEVIVAVNFQFKQLEKISAQPHTIINVDVLIMHASYCLFTWPAAP